MNAAQKEIQKLITSAERLYDNNEYANGMRVVTKLLQKQRDHPEGIALKALFLNAQKKTAEAMPLIQQAVRADMKNAKIWKFQGIIFRNNGEYTKAAQSLTMSRKCNNLDMSVLQDLCNLYLFERNYTLFAEAARDLLKKNTYAASIVRYSLALQLTGKLRTADHFLKSYEDGLLPTQHDDELIFHSELCLHHASLMFERGKFKKCEKYLTTNQRIRDTVSKNEWLAKVYVAQDKKAEALETVELLIREYPENGDYFDILEKLMAGDEYLTHLFGVKDRLKSRYAEVRILEIMDMTDARFEGLLKEFLVPYLAKGTPSIFVYLSELSQEKLDMAVAIARAADIPICYIPIVHNFVASVMMARLDYEAALVEADQGLAHTATTIELMVTKVRILMRLGRVSEAAEEAQKLSKADPTDRNTNMVLIKALLANGELKAATVAAEPFSTDHEGKSKLMLVQFNELCHHCARCAIRANDSATATTFYEYIVRHFDEFRKGQYNYIGWGMKKTVALMNMLKWANDLDKSPILGMAVLGLMKIKLAEGDFNGLDDLALRMTEATDPSVLAYTAAYFARKSDALVAIKCFMKTTGSALFAAAPAIAKMMGSLGDIPDVVKEVATELYTPFNASPETLGDLLMAARGALLVDDKAKCRTLLQQAVAKATLYREALEVYNAAMFELKDDEFGTKIEAEFLARSPKFQLKAQGVYEVPEFPVAPAED